MNDEERKQLELKSLDEIKNLANSFSVTDEEKQETSRQFEQMKLERIKEQESVLGEHFKWRERGSQEDELFRQYRLIGWSEMRKIATRNRYAKFNFPEIKNKGDYYSLEKFFHGKSIPDLEKLAWLNFSEMRFHYPGKCPITNEIFSLLTFEQWSSEFKEHIEKIGEKDWRIHEEVIALAKECCRKEGTPYSPPIEVVMDRRESFKPYNLYDGQGGFYGPGEMASLDD